MTRTLTVSVASAPIGQPRARHAVSPQGHIARIVSTADKRVKVHRAHLIAAMKHAAQAAGWTPPAGPVDVSWISYHATPKADRWGLFCTNKPDRDNIDKLALDAAQAAGLLPKGDQRVASGTLQKVWCRPGLQGLVVTIRSLDGERPSEEEDDDLGASEARPEAD